MAPPHGQMLKHEKIFLSETIWPRVLIFSMLHHLVDLYQVFQIMPLGPKLAPPLGSHAFYIICLHCGKQGKNALSDTIWPRVLIFGM